jgi:predicted acylesterase/phospholipase RssA
MRYDLVFEGGGAKGTVFVGAYAEFVTRGHTFGRLLGTSAGAITAAMIAAGYTPDEMEKALTEQKNGRSVFAGFLGDPQAFTPDEVHASAIRKLLRDINLKFVPDLLEDKIDQALAEKLAEDERSRHIFAFVERGGWFDAAEFIAWMSSKLDEGQYHGAGRNFSRMTLAQFFAATQVDVSVVASDTTAGRIIVLNHRTAPACPLVMAVRMSMSIPLLWDEVLWQPEWGPYLGKSIAGHAIVDGGMLSNFPIELFISDEPPVTRLMGPKQAGTVLGMLIDDDLPVPQPAVAAIPLVEVNVKPMELATVQRLARLVNTATGAHDKMVLDEFEHLVVRLPAGGYGTVEFDMTEIRRQALLEAGRNTMAAYFDLPRPAATASEAEMAQEAARAAAKADRIAAAILVQD